jgi:oxygen-independent coproporphyrinogen-3 oxidase
MELMSNFSLNIKRVEDDFKVNFKEYFSDAIEALKEFEEAELLKISDDKIEVSQTGTMLIRNICMPFDAYLNRIPEDKRRFSKTI